MKAVLLVTTRPGTKKYVYNKLCQDNSIVRVYKVRGAYDMLAIADTKDVSFLQKNLKQNIQGIGYITAVVPSRKKEKDIQETYYYF